VVDPALAVLSVLMTLIMLRSASLLMHTSAYTPYQPHHHSEKCHVQVEDNVGGGE
jgi:hypothetical protein